jgi:hypothetical protein
MSDNHQSCFHVQYRTVVRQSEYLVLSKQASKLFLSVYTFFGDFSAAQPFLLQQVNNQLVHDFLISQQNNGLIFFFLSL